MDQIMNYVKPELLVLAVVLYFVGVGMKKTETIADKYIPVSLGGLRNPAVRYLGGCHLPIERDAGNRNGSVYSDCPGHTGGWIIDLRQPGN